MQIYLAPMEGITGFVFRNAYAKYYGGVDKYFTPFITPHTKKSMDARELRDILPDNNKNVVVVPQVLTNKVEELIVIAKELKNFGYDEINLNIGCPSKTVTAKQKGAGFLEDTKKLEQFFEQFFCATDLKLSIKTRIGMWETDEWERLAFIYEKFPFEEIIVHPRLGCEFYQGMAHRDLFEFYCDYSKKSLCYNGDIVTRDDLFDLDYKWPQCNKFMIGRGLIANPGMLLGSNAHFMEFHNEILEGYASYLSGDQTVLFRMKELWFWWTNLFLGQEKIIKKIKKTNTLKEYQSLVSMIIKQSSDL